MDAVSMAVLPGATTGAISIRLARFERKQSLPNRAITKTEVGAACRLLQNARAMRLRHIEVIFAVSRAGSISGAAKALSITQPAASKLLKAAEQQLRFPLFRRVSGRIHPTEEASALLADIERVAARFGVRPGGESPAGTAAGTESLVVLVDRSTRAAGLGAYLKRNEPEGNTGIRLRFEDVPFDGLISWLADLQATQGVGVVAATADPGQEPGRVTANIQLARAAR